MRHIKCIVGTTFLLTIFCYSTAQAKQNGTNNKPNTFTEQTEPSISIKPLGREQQEAKEKERLASTIKIIPAPGISTVQTVTASEITNESRQKPQKWDVLASDVRLANTFERWGQKAGWRVQWDASKHFLLDGASTFTGSFEDAIKAALMTPGIRQSAYPLEACVYDNTPPLIRITRQGEQTQSCPD